MDVNLVRSCIQQKILLHFHRGQGFDAGEPVDSWPDETNASESKIVCPAAAFVFVANLFQFL